jgi:hypothetical protein
MAEGFLTRQAIRVQAQLLESTHQHLAEGIRTGT